MQKNVSPDNYYTKSELEALRDGLSSGTIFNEISNYFEQNAKKAKQWKNEMLERINICLTKIGNRGSGIYSEPLSQLLKQISIPLLAKNTENKKYMDEANAANLDKSSKNILAIYNNISKHTEQQLQIDNNNWLKFQGAVSIYKLLQEREKNPNLPMGGMDKNIDQLAIFSALYNGPIDGKTYTTLKYETLKKNPNYINEQLQALSPEKVNEILRESCKNVLDDPSIKASYSGSTINKTSTKGKHWGVWIPVMAVGALAAVTPAILSAPVAVSWAATYWVGQVVLPALVFGSAGTLGVAGVTFLNPWSKFRKFNSLRENILGKTTEQRKQIFEKAANIINNKGEQKVTYADVKAQLARVGLDFKKKEIKKIVTGINNMLESNDPNNTSYLDKYLANQKINLGNVTTEAFVKSLPKITPKKKVTKKDIEKLKKEIEEGNFLNRSGKSLTFSKPSILHPIQSIRSLFETQQIKALLNVSLKTDEKFKEKKFPRVNEESYKKSAPKRQFFEKSLPKNFNDLLQISPNIARALGISIPAPAKVFAQTNANNPPSTETSTINTSPNATTEDTKVTTESANNNSSTPTVDTTKADTSKPDTAKVKSTDVDNSDNTDSTAEKDNNDKKDQKRKVKKKQPFTNAMAEKDATQETSTKSTKMDKTAKTITISKIDFLKDSETASYIIENLGKVMELTKADEGNIYGAAYNVSKSKDDTFKFKTQFAVGEKTYNVTLSKINFLQEGYKALAILQDLKQKVEKVNSGLKDTIYGVDYEVEKVQKKSTQK